jgi:hypothetical protein
MKIKKIENISQPTFHDVRKWYDNHLHPDVNDYNDQSVYKYVYHEGRFPGVFQLTSNGAQKLFKQAKPESIIDIAVLTSIYRPGPLAAKVDKIYLESKAGNKFDWGHPIFEKVLGQTYNCLTGDMKVLTDSGEIRIDEIEQGMTIPSLNESTGEIVQDKVIAKVNNGIKEILEIETEIGVLKLTPEHKVLTTNGWKEAKDITLDDEIISIQDYTYLSRSFVKDNERKE